MKFWLLVLLNHTVGWALAILCCTAIGFLVAAIIALGRVGVARRNVGLLVMYIVFAGLAGGLVVGGLYVAEWVGAQTEYVGRVALYVGAFFPGCLGLKIIPAFARIANSQTVRADVE